MQEADSYLLEKAGLSLTTHPVIVDLADALQRGALPVQQGRVKVERRSGKSNNYHVYFTRSEVRLVRVMDKYVRSM